MIAICYLTAGLFLFLFPFFAETTETMFAGFHLAASGLLFYARHLFCRLPEKRPLEPCG